MEGPDSPNQNSYHPELRGCNLRLMGCLSYHLELNGWSLGLVERPDFTTRTPLSFELRGRSFVLMGSAADLFQNQYRPERRGWALD